jgi:hypothetical protein
MSPLQLTDFRCKYCGKAFTDGRALGGHVRQSHPAKPQGAHAPALQPSDGETAARVLELWQSGSNPLAVISALRVHPRFVKEVLADYDELLNEWKKFREA